MTRRQRKIKKTLDHLFSEIETEQFLDIVQIPQKGRGIKSNKVFFDGEWVLEYKGTLLTAIEAQLKETEYASDPSTGSFMFFFKSQDQSLCVDATCETLSKGRLINHSIKDQNVRPRVMKHRGYPRIVFVAKRDIGVGEELLYDYGDRSAKSLEDHPWLAC